MKYYIYILAVLALASCSSVNLLYQKQIGDYYAKGQGGSFAMSGKYIKPMPLEAGQWVMTGTTSDGKRSIQKTSIIGQEEGGWIFDMYNLNEEEETASQMLIVGIDKFNRPEDIDNIKIVWVKMKDKDGIIQTMEGPMMELMGSFYKKGLNNFLVNSDGSLDGGSVTVPAGTFAGCAKIKTEVTFLGSTYTSYCWYHPDVPINGMLKSVSEDNDVVTELIDFGKSGAKRSF